MEMDKEERPVCGRCGIEMTPENSQRHPEFFLCDNCCYELGIQLST